MRASLAIAMGLVVGCGGPAVPSASTPVASIARVADEAPPATREEPPAPGAQLAGGRLGLALDGIAPGAWTLAGRFGVSPGGPDAASDHVVTRTTDAGTYSLHVIAWDSLRPSTLGVESALRGARAIESGDPDLEIAAVLDRRRMRDRSEGPERALYDEHRAEVMAQLVVAVREGTMVNVALACEESAACAADDHPRIAHEIAGALRRGPRLSRESTWTLRLPDGASTDRVVRVALPRSIVALPPRPAPYEPEVVTRLVSLDTGALVLELAMRVDADEDEVWTLDPGSRDVGEGEPREARVPCEPFVCMAYFADESVRDALINAIARATTEPAPAIEERHALAGGRLVVRLASGRIDDAWHVNEAGNGPDDHHDHHLRFGTAEGEEVLLHLDVADTLRPGEDPVAAAREAGWHPTDARLEPLEASDPALEIARVVPSQGFARDGDRWIAGVLVIGEREGTALVVELYCVRDERCVAEDDAALRELARRFERGAPIATARTLEVSMAEREIAITLPEGYVLDRWDDPFHGGWSVTATHVRAPFAQLTFEDSGASEGASVENVGPRLRGRATLRLGEERLALIERRGRDGTVWTADLGCREGACMVMITTEDRAERERLIAAMAGAAVTRRPPCLRGYVDDESALNVRASPGAQAPVTGTVEVGGEVTIAETRGRWSRITAPIAGWVWDRAIVRTCE
ncbi:SH3 domain-containing protein [Sandaracinus amylolyticus]|uniref:SH3b domain-containing protein n=1 Tax=Sandaracinus amylolyticus TaxID=927083 RepID=A0A0F6VZA3_9BACT|nr:SH3 domain-containing protein [Sandaracinus amylolyticus]AKF03271.1 hypothetical protein DB32_000420 [Sandaracinus amylolyticus]